MASGVSADGDTLTSIEAVIGSAFADRLVAAASGNSEVSGGEGDDVVVQSSKRDILFGDLGRDTVSYANAVTRVVVELALNRGTISTAGLTTVDQLAGFEVVIGGVFSDRLEGADADEELQGGDGDDALNGRGGDDVLDGGTGEDTAEFSDVAPVTANLEAGQARSSGSGSETDALRGIENLVGTSFDNRLTGDAGDNLLDGGRSGRDTLVGGNGVDTASWFFHFVAGISASLVTGTSSDGDTLDGIENLLGSGADDRLTGEDGVNALSGGAGDDVLDGRAGADRLDGGLGVNTASYASAAVGVTVDLNAGTGSDGDTLLRIQSAVGSAFGDVLRAGGSGSTSSGGGGGDRLVARVATDVTTLAGDGGSDTADFSQVAVTPRRGVEIDLSNGAPQSSPYGIFVLSAVENVIGTAGDDALTGDGQSNTLEGGDGADLLDGGGGRDSMMGGRGDDTYVVK